MNKHRIATLTIMSLFASVLLAAEVQRVGPLAATNTMLAPRQPDPAGLTWLTDLQKAQARAKAEEKSVLLFFHGSDWCPTCAEMQRQVFDSAAFVQYARKTLVLMDVDFPEKHQQNEELRKANLTLKARFNLSQESGEGFPTLVLLNAAGETVFQETGYAGGGPAEVLSKLQRHAGTGASTADSSFKNLSVDEFARMADDKRNAILDVRTPKEFQAGHIPGAVNLDVSAADFQAKAASLDKGKTYLVECASGVRSARACETLSGLGFPSLYNLPGGFRAWMKAGKPVEK